MTKRLAPASLAASLVALAVAAPGASAQCGLPDPCEPPPPQPPGTTPVAPSPAPTDARGVDPRSPNPLLRLRFFVDPHEPAYRQWRRYRRRGMGWRAATMWKVAGRPRFKWFGRWTRHGPALVGKIRAWLDDSQRHQPGSVPLMVVMRHQGKKCDPRRYAAGGAREDARSRKWYRRFARAVGSRRVVIAFEPDSLGTVDCLKRSRRFARLKLLRYGVKVLSQLPNATIYLEGGASDWEPARRTAWQLRYIGIHRVRGFMLNVTHYAWTRDNIRHGLEISRRTGGKPFIISTAFNGRGPVHFRTRVGRRIRRINVWCHPLKRGLGPPPTTSTHHRKVDAYMWIGRPGYSGGSCNGGPLPIGSWWSRRALMFGRWATNWVGRPRGTRYGHFKRWSYRQLGGRPLR